MDAPWPVREERALLAASCQTGTAALHPGPGVSINDRKHVGDGLRRSPGSEEELLRQARDGDEPARCTLYEIHVVPAWPDWPTAFSVTRARPRTWVRWFSAG